MMSSEASLVPAPSHHFFTSEAYAPGPHHFPQPQPMFQQDSICGILQTQYLPFNGNLQQTPMQYQNVHPPPMCVPLAESRFGASPSLPTTALDSCQQISHVLQCYQQGGEDSEFVRKAIESLVKKLKDKRIELDALITAITSGGKQHTSCVTIQRSLDGRLQVAGRKGVPHVVYARIWRWPNVNKNELVKMSVCAIPCDHQDFICINPYHYERVVSNGLAPLDMKTLRIEPPPEIEATKNEYAMSTEYTDLTDAGRNTSEEQGFPDWMPSCAVTRQQDIYQGPAYPNPAFPLAPPVNVDLSQVQLPNSNQLPDHWCSITYYELDSQVGETFKVWSDMCEVDIDGGMDPQGDRNGRFCLGALSNVHRGESSEMCRIHIGGGVHLSSQRDGNVIIEVRSRKPVFIRSGFLDYCTGVPYGSKVHRFTAGNGRTTVFDLRWAYREMVLRTQCATQAVRAQAAAVAGLGHGPQMSNLSDVMADSGVDGMRSAFCTLSMSFVKGWGVGYPRNSIKETPCWVELQLHRPLQLLDQILKTAGPL